MGLVKTMWGLCGDRLPRSPGRIWGQSPVFALFSRQIWHFPSLILPSQGGLSPSESLSVYNRPNPRPSFLVSGDRPSHSLDSAADFGDRPSRCLDFPARRRGAVGLCYNMPHERAW